MKTGIHNALGRQATEPKSPTFPTGNLVAWWISGAIVLAVGVLLLGVCAVSQAFLSCDVTTFMQSMRALEEEQDRFQQLEERLRKFPETEMQKNQVVIDLIKRQCSLHEAATRFQALWAPSVLRCLYPQAATEEDRVIMHLVYLIGQKPEVHSNERAEVLARLQAEWALLRAQAAVAVDSARKELPPAAL